MTEGPRDRATRKADTLALVTTPAIDTWVATASADGTPHLVPLSLAWVDDRAVVAVEASSATARNVAGSGRARLAVGPTRDVVMVDAILERSLEVDADASLGEAYAAQADWDPRGSAGLEPGPMIVRPEACVSLMRAPGGRRRAGSAPA